MIQMTILKVICGHYNVLIIIFTKLKEFNSVDGIGIIGNVSLIAGENRMLTCLASTRDSTMISSYQWLKDGRELSGQTSTTLSFSPLRQNDTGLYTCRVIRGSVSSTAHVSINIVGELEKCY